MSNFYCQKVCGEVDFSIEEWNRVQQSLEATNLTEKEKQAILFPPACSQQCFDCLAIVGERRKQTQQLLNKKT